MLIAVQTAQVSAADELEAFRLQYLGSKNQIKPLMGEIRNVSNDRKKEYGQAVNDDIVTELSDYGVDGAWHSSRWISLQYDRA